MNESWHTYARVMAHMLQYVVMAHMRQYVLSPPYEIVIHVPMKFTYFSVKLSWPYETVVHLPMKFTYFNMKLSSTYEIVIHLPMKFTYFSMKLSSPYEIVIRLPMKFSWLSSSSSRVLIVSKERERETVCITYSFTQTYDVGLHSRRHAIDFDGGTRPFASYDAPSS